MSKRLDKRLWGVLGKQQTYFSPQKQVEGKTKTPLNANAFDSWDAKRSRFKRVDGYENQVPNHIQQHGVVPQDTTPTPSITPSITPTPSSTPAPPFDVDAAAYLADILATGGTLNATISAATDTLFTSLKSNGLYTKLQVFYPVVGGIASSNALMGKRSSGTTYDLIFNGGFTHTSSGSTGNGTNGWANTKYPNNLNNQLDMSFGFYQLNNDTSYVNMGVRDSSPTVFLPSVIASNNESSNNYFFRLGTDANAQASSLNAQTGMFIGSRTSNTNASYYRNGNTTPILSLGYTYTTGASSSSVIIFWNFNNEQQFFGVPNPQAGYFANCIMNCMFIGTGLSALEQQTLAGIFNTFNTSLGRNTY